MISYSTEAIQCYVGEGLRHVGAALDAGEFLEVEAMSVDALLAALDRGEITRREDDDGAAAVRALARSCHRAAH